MGFTSKKIPNSILKNVVQILGNNWKNAPRKSYMPITFEK
jgi:hypothetical protein